LGDKPAKVQRPDENGSIFIPARCAIAPAKKPGNGLEKGLANLESGKKITKKTHAGRGQTTNWEADK
jgi:hypothetical protein